ncbi:MAG: tRNA (guanosine(46)-N7)-methyltransferase TrmB [Bacteroidota bacterium]
MRRKLERFAQNKLSRNVLEDGKEIFETIKGKWHEFFGNDQPLVVELGCGRGEYTIGLAQNEPHKNYIGVDIKGDRIWKGSTQAMEFGLDHVAFLRTQIVLLDKFFEKGEISEIWITFPDPRPKDRDIKRRLTSPRFLKMYRELLKKDGWIRFKTDNTPLFDYTLELFDTDVQVKDLEYTHDLYNSPLLEEHYGVKTKYEKIFTEKGEDIKYMKFRFA